jgi:hypothetical protein
MKTLSIQKIDELIQHAFRQEKAIGIGIPIPSAVKSLRSDSKIRKRESRSSLLIPHANNSLIPPE